MDIVDEKEDRKKLAIGILTMKERKQYLRRTIESINSDDIVILSDVGYGCTSADFNEAYRRLTDLFPSAEYLLVLPDDCIAARNTIPALAYILREYRPEILACYSDKATVVLHPHPAIIRLPAEQYNSDLGTVLRKDIYMRYREWIASFKFWPRLKDAPDLIANSDVLLRTFAYDESITILATVPCLFQHIGEISSINSEWIVRNRPRQTRKFLGEEADALDWFTKHRNDIKS